MNKEQIDELIQIIVKMQENIMNDSMVAQYSKEETIFELCKNENLKKKGISILKQLVGCWESFELGNENEQEQLLEQLYVLMEEFENIKAQIHQDIHSQIPEDLLNYYYIEVHCNRVQYYMKWDEEQSREAEQAYDTWVEEVVNGNDLQAKIDALKKERLDGSIQYRILRTLSYSEELEQILQQIDNDILKVNIIDKVKDPTKKIQLTLHHIKNDSSRKILMMSIADSELLETLENFEGADKAFIATNIRDLETRMQLLDKFEGQDWISVAATLPNEKKVSLLDGIDEDRKIALIQTIYDPELRLNALDKLENKEILETLKRMAQINEDVIIDIDLRMLDKRYIETLGEDKINLISCFPEIQEGILALTERQYEVFERCLSNFLSQKETDEWTVVAQSILENLQSGEYAELIEGIEDLDGIDIRKLTTIMQFPNDFELRTTQDVMDYEKIKIQKCDEIINGDGHIAQKRNVTLIKIFGHDLKYAKTIIEKYGEDIESIEDGDVKDYVRALKELMSITDEETLKQIYDECEPVQGIDKAFIERSLKTAYGKMFNKGLYETKDENILGEDQVPEELKKLGVKIYDAGTDFKMIITSVAPYVENNPKDFKKDWNRPAIASQHFCASYIRNDMIGTAPIPHMCYGFTQMKDDSLMLSGSKDLASTNTGFVSDVLRSEEYHSPDEQINTTMGYNEMDFRRIQGGVKKQPDYIVAFRKNGKIDNMDKIIQATQDWRAEIPIVIVDVDLCLEQQHQQVNDLLEQYNASKSPEIARQLLQKVRNNRMTDPEFCVEIENELEQIRKESEQLEAEGQAQNKVVTAEDLETSSAGISAQERMEGVGEMRKLLTRVQEIAQDKEGEDIEL